MRTNEYLAAKKIGTYDKNRSIISKLKKYAQDEPLVFEDITSMFLLDYENYLRTTLGNCTNTIHKDMKFIRKLFNDAYRRDLIELNVNPFLKYKMKTEKTQRTYLTESELESIQKLSFKSGTRLSLHKDMFVFACYAGGIRVSDVLQLNGKIWIIHVSIFQ